MIEMGVTEDRYKELCLVSFNTHLCYMIEFQHSSSVFFHFLTNQSIFSINYPFHGQLIWLKAESRSRGGSVAGKWNLIWIKLKKNTRLQSCYFEGIENQFNAVLAVLLCLEKMASSRAVQVLQWMVHTHTKTWTCRIWWQNCLFYQ